MDYTVHGILQARILEWVAVPFSRGPSKPRDRTQVSRIVGGFFTQVSCIAEGFFYQLSYQGSPILNRKITVLQPVTMTNMYVTFLTEK